MGSLKHLMERLTKSFSYVGRLLKEHLPTRDCKPSSFCVAIVLFTFFMFLIEGVFAVQYPLKNMRNASVIFAAVLWLALLVLVIFDLSRLCK